MASVLLFKRMQQVKIANAGGWIDQSFFAMVLTAKR
jgi:hypothetical protein